MAAVDVGGAVRSAAAGDAAAWSTLIDRYAGLVWAVTRAHGLSVADADDVTQTTWLRLAEHLGRIRDPDRVGLWLAVTARNECLRMLRRARRDIPFDPHADDFAHATVPDVDVDLLTNERDRQLWVTFQALSALCKVLLLTLMAEPGLSYADVSRTLGMPVGSIGPTRARCLDRLRRNWTAAQHDEAMEARGGRGE